MKATVYYKIENGRATRKTIDVEEKNPCSIVKEFIKVTGFPKSTYISHIKCCCRDYQWSDTCYSAY